MYNRESELVRDFVGLLRGCAAPWPDMDVAFEFNYHSGRVDVIGVNPVGELFSFEAKLTRWREALHQAYRSTSFSHQAYIVVPEPVAQKAALFCHEFELRGVGLCAISSKGISVEIPALPQEPFLPWLTSNALDYIVQVNLGWRKL